MRCLDCFDFMPVSFVCNSYKIEETCFFCSLEFSKPTGEFVFCGNKIKAMSPMIISLIYALEF